MSTSILRFRILLAISWLGMTLFSTGWACATNSDSNVRMNCVDRCVLELALYCGKMSSDSELDDLLRELQLETKATKRSLEDGRRMLSVLEFETEPTRFARFSDLGFVGTALVFLDRPSTDSGHVILVTSLADS